MASMDSYVAGFNSHDVEVALSARSYLQVKGTQKTCIPQRVSALELGKNEAIPRGQLLWASTGDDDSTPV